MSTGCNELQCPLLLLVPFQGIGEDDDEAVEASSLSLTETEEGFQPVFFDPRPLRNLRMVDEIESLSPITDFKVHILVLPPAEPVTSRMPDGLMCAPETTPPTNRQDSFTQSALGGPAGGQPAEGGDTAAVRHVRAWRTVNASRAAAGPCGSGGGCVPPPWQSHCSVDPQEEHHQCQ